MKIAGDVDEIYLEGTMSQIFYSCPSFYFMKSRKFSLKNVKKLPVFFL